jgi:dihydrofolate synthase / folylpolyglutamate synthase
MKAGYHGASFPTVRKALETAKENASENDLILITGSTFVVAEVI